MRTFQDIQYMPLVNIRLFQLFYQSIVIVDFYGTMYTLLQHNPNNPNNGQYSAVVKFKSGTFVCKY